MLALIALASACSSRSVLLGTITDDRVSAGTAGRESVHLGTSGTSGTAGSAGRGGSTVPIVVGTVDLSAAGPAIRLLVGDVSGDGRYDIVAMQPDKVPDGKTPHAVLALTAYDLEGNRLWQIGTPDPSITGSSSDIPAQIYDLDGDGFNEVLAVVNDRFVVVDGRTGRTKAERDLPDPNAHDAIVIANVSGHRRPDDILLKDRSSNLWAFDAGFGSLFKYTGSLGYYPWPYDWDGDGRDEIMTGCQFLKSDGTEAWSCSQVVGDNFVDAVWAADLDPSNGNGSEVVVGAGDVFAFDRSGKLLWRVDTREAQNIVVGDFRPDLPGLEVGGLDRIQRASETTLGTDGMFLISSAGTLLLREERPPDSGWNTIVTMLRDWDGTGRDLIVAYARAGSSPSLYDGQFNVVATFPEEKGQLIPVDLCGDARQEIVAFADGTARLYASSPCDLRSQVTGKPRPQPKRLYNWTRYWGAEYPEAQPIQ